MGTFETSQLSFSRPDEVYLRLDVLVWRGPDN